MEILLGFGSDLATKRACKLKKPLYGLKQPSRAWFGRFAKVIKTRDTNKVREIIRCSSNLQIQGGVTTLLVYVDDIIVTGNDEKERQTLRQCLTKKFEIKELGKLKYFQGIEVVHSKQGIFISQ